MTYRNPLSDKFVEFRLISLNRIKNITLQDLKDASW